MDRKQIIDNLTVSHVKEILNELGSQPPIDLMPNTPEHQIIFTTVCHGGKRHKLYYYTNSKYFHCYSNCGQLSVFDVVMKAKGWSRFSTTDYIGRIVGVQDRKYTFGFQVDSGKYLIDDWEFINRYKRNEVRKVELPTYDSTVMDLFTKEYHMDWVNDGIGIEAMEKYNIRFYLPQNAIVIPHYDMDGNLVGIRRRTFVPELEKDKKYMPIYIQGKGYTHPLQFNLYGIHRNKDTIKKFRKVVLVEGEKSVLQCETFYPGNNFTLALSSSNISNAQRDMILGLGVDEVIFALDRQYLKVGDEDYTIYQEKMLRLMSKFTPYVNVYILWDMEDVLPYKASPTDMGKDAFEYLMKNKIQVTTKEHREGV